VVFVYMCVSACGVCVCECVCVVCECISMCVCVCVPPSYCVARSSALYGY